MKNAISKLLLLALISSGCASANSANSGLDQSDSGEFQYQDVIDVEGRTKSELHAKAREWIAMNYISANDVIQLDDEERGLMIVKGAYGGISHLLISNWTVRHTLKIESRDGRLRVTINQFTAQGPDQGAKEGALDAFMGASGLQRKVRSRVEEQMTDFRNFLVAPEENW